MGDGDGRGILNSRWRETKAFAILAPIAIVHQCDALQPAQVDSTNIVQSSTSLVRIPPSQSSMQAGQLTPPESQHPPPSLYRRAVAWFSGCSSILDPSGLQLVYYHHLYVTSASSHPVKARLIFASPSPETRLVIHPYSWPSKTAFQSF